MSKLKLDYKYIIFIVMLALYTFVYFQRVSPAAIATDLMEDIKLNASELGIISSSYFLFYALVQPFVGYFTDKYGPKKVILASFSMTVLASMLFGLVDNFYSAIVARSIIGISTGGIFIPSLRLLAEWFAPGQFARINGLFIGLGGAGGALLATIPLSYLDLLLGWRNVFFLVSFLGAFLVFIILFTLNDKTPESSKKEPAAVEKINYFDTVRKLVFSRNFLIIELIFFTSFGAYLSFQGLWATKYLSSVMNISPQVANGLIFFLPIGYLIGAPLGGYLAEKVFNNKVVLLRAGLISLFISWAVVTFLTASLPGHVLISLLLLMGISIGMVPTLVFSIIRELVPPQAMGLSFGLANPAIFAGVFAFQLTTGLILEFFKVNNTYTSYTFFIMMSFCLTSLLVITFLSFLLSDNLSKNSFKARVCAFCFIKKWTHSSILQRTKTYYQNYNYLFPDITQLRRLLHLK